MTTLPNYPHIAIQESGTTRAVLCPRCGYMIKARNWRGTWWNWATAYVLQGRLRAHFHEKHHPAEP